MSGISPDITGGGNSWNEYLDIAPYGFANTYGAIAVSKSGKRKYSTPYESGETEGVLGWKLTASLSNNVFGKSSTLQINSLRLLAIIKF